MGFFHPQIAAMTKWAKRPISSSDHLARAIMRNYRRKRLSNLGVSAIDYLASMEYLAAAGRNRTRECKWHNFCILKLRDVARDRRLKDYWHAKHLLNEVRHGRKFSAFDQVISPQSQN